MGGSGGGGLFCFEDLLQVSQPGTALLQFPPILTRIGSLFDSLYGFLMNLILRKYRKCLSDILQACSQAGDFLEEITALHIGTTDFSMHIVFRHSGGKTPQSVRCSVSRS